MFKPSIQRVLLAFAAALLASAPLVVEHAGLRSMWDHELDEHAAHALETQANLVEARLTSIFDLLLHKTEALAADDALETAVANATANATIDSGFARQARGRLLETIRPFEQGALAWIVLGDGSVLAGTDDAHDSLRSANTNKTADARADAPKLNGRVKSGNRCYFEFTAPMRRQSTGAGSALANLVVRVPAEPIDRWIADVIRDLRVEAWAVAVTAGGQCILDSRGDRAECAASAPAPGDLARLDKTQQFGPDTNTILRTLGARPQLIKILEESKTKNPSARLRRIQAAKIDLLFVASTASGSRDRLHANRIAFALVAIVAITVFVFAYARFRDGGAWIKPSVGAPVMAGLLVLLICAGGTLYVTHAMDDHGRGQARAFGQLVENSLIHDLDSAIDTRTAYFAELNNRLANYREGVREEFMAAAAIANETFPDGVLKLTRRDDLADEADKEVTISPPTANINIRGTARLQPGAAMLEKPEVYTVRGAAGTQIVFDAPFRERSGTVSRLLWCIDVSRLLSFVLSPERTSGFAVSLVSLAEPGVAVYPAGLAASQQSLGSIPFAFPRGNGAPHRLALEARVDLFGAETSRNVVFLLGMFITVAGSISTSLIVGTLTNYRRASRIDPLTGMRNRMDFDESLVRETERARRHGRELSLVVVDLDHFKRINDQFKHAAGDDVLRSFAGELTAMLRKSDLVFRYGGEEFAIVLPETANDAAHVVIDRVRERFAGSPLPGLNRLGIVTFSAGVASWDGEESIDSLVDRADAAMYEAKNTGRNRVVAAPERRRVFGRAGRGPAALV